MIIDETSYFQMNNKLDTLMIHMNKLCYIIKINIRQQNFDVLNYDQMNLVYAPYSHEHIHL